MTNKAQGAYVIGFCKTAEAYGVDPNELMKVAINLSSIRGISTPTARQIFLGAKKRGLHGLELEDYYRWMKGMKRKFVPYDPSRAARPLQPPWIKSEELKTILDL